MEFCTLASGSKGNMTYIASGDEAFLIDAGISLSSARARAPEGVDFSRVKAILVTHEHGDHVAFLGTIARKLGVPVWIHPASYDALPAHVRQTLAESDVLFIKEKKTYTLGGFKIATLPLFHDSASILGFYITATGKAISYAADTGIFPESLFPLFRVSDAVLIEANHDVALLAASDRDYFVKRRALSAEGHLSNDATLAVLEAITSPRLTHVVLLHASEECNSDQAIRDDIITPFSTKSEACVMIARQHASLPLIEV